MTNTNYTTHPVCDSCGGDALILDVTATWDSDTMRPVIDDIYDQGHYCQTCEDHCRLDWKDIKYSKDENQGELKYYIGTITAMCGAYEFDTSVKFKTAINPEIYLNEIARTWYETDPEIINGGWWHNGELCVKAHSYQTITQAAFEELLIIPRF